MTAGGFGSPGAASPTGRRHNSHHPRQTTTSSVTTDAPVRLTPVYGSDGIRPWNRTLTIRVSDGALAPGDIVTITLGDTTGGSPGMRAQTFPERRFRFQLQADPFGAGVYEHVTDLGFPITGSPATRLVAVAPSDVVAGEPFRLQVRALDRWGNPDPGYPGAASASMATSRTDYRPPTR